MKKVLLLFMLIFSVTCSFAQTEEEVSKKISSYEQFTSKTGTLIRYTEFDLPDIVKGSWKSYAMTANLRKVTIGDNVRWYLHIEKERYQRSNISVYIPQSDLEELLRAVDQLEVIYGELSNIGEATYVEEKFETNDDLRIGFYIDRKVKKNGEEEITKKWFLNLDYRLYGGTKFFDSSAELKNCFSTALEAISNYSR
ncbi:hypothetical protein E4T81_00470 [Barnesiella sp. WM24]|uniref:hypothetical protein n=1 Tax=Barnesiella sp. WM24 TaxID=2558278 RepID=UPI001071769C|nr:hypothetical protein [Barnesiella sp. WM24]TFU95042.1 hypothetical protein E4T81_00470 [Barnesiella sp. WM24]